MKTPGLFFRISFLVILNSLFVFAAVTMVSIENNKSKINNLIAFRFSFVSQYFRMKLDDFKGEFSISNVDSTAVANFEEFYDSSDRFMEGLTGLAVLSYDKEIGEYRAAISAFKDEMTAALSGELSRISLGANHELIASKKIQVGEKIKCDIGYLKTIYIPWDEKNPDQILAITFLPGEITSGDDQYYYTISILFLVITLITLLIINLLSRRFIKPLHHLIMGMEKTAEGKVLYQIENVGKDEIGRVAGSFNTMVDTIWKKRQELNHTLEQLSNANQSLAESKKFLAKLIENAPFGIIVTDSDGNIQIFSKAAIDMFGVARENALNTDIRNMFPFAPEKVIPGNDTTNLSAEREMICSKGDNETFPALVNRLPIRDDTSEIRAYLFIIRDITESKGFHEMMISIDRMATRGVMAGEIAHEINNYLAVILGNVELIPLLLQKGAMEKLEKKLEVLKNSVAKIQQFSEGLAGDMNEKAKVEPNDLNQLIENLVAFLKPQNHYDNIKFKLDLSHEMPLVDIDAGQIQQMMTNLLNNAAGALQERQGSKEIHISSSLSDDHNSAVLFIRDNAGGLPEDLEKVIFRERFLGKRRGRGFGLVIVKRIVDRHQGQIEYKSISGEGTIFTVQLPVKAPQINTDTVASPAGQVPA